MIAHGRAEPVKPERVVLLGARSFIGRSLGRVLDEAGVSWLGLTSQDIDLCAAGAADALASRIRPTDAIVMLAALTPDKGRDLATLSRNIAMVQNTTAAVQKTGCAQFIYFSSDAVYGLSPSYVNEATPAAPQDLYGAMHLTREIAVQALQCPVLVLRPTMVYGIEDTHNAYGPNRFRRAAAAEGRITLFGEGEETRDHVHVEDVARVTLRCLLSASTGVLNVATGRSSSFRRVAEMVADQFRGDVTVSGSPRVNPISHRHYDTTNLVRAFPDFRFMTLADGIARCHQESKKGA